VITAGHFRVAEAMVALAIAKGLIRVMRFERLRPLTGPVASAMPDALPGPAREPRAAAVGAAIRRGSQRLPWYSSCLARALAGRMMLSWRRVPSTLVLGVATDGGGIRGHAWLVAGGGFVCGGKEAPRFRAIASFGGDRR
jgi:hypothetical protein